jgi:hypothetical protein
MNGMKTRSKSAANAGDALSGDASMSGRHRSKPLLHVPSLWRTEKDAVAVR